MFIFYSIREKRLSSFSHFGKLIINCIYFVASRRFKFKTVKNSGVLNFVSFREINKEGRNGMKGSDGKIICFIQAFYVARCALVLGVEPFVLGFGIEDGNGIKILGCAVIDRSVDDTLGD